MISADHFSDNGDGTAWMLIDDPVFYQEDFDIPCDTCEGQEPPWLPLGPGAVQTVCAARCIDGRYTFDIELAVCYDGLENAWVGGRRVPKLDHVGFESSRIESVSYRASVIPGMVLPMFTWSHPLDPSMTFPCLMQMSRGYWLMAQSEMFSDGFQRPLPPAARAGMWAVQLRIERLDS